MKCTFGFEFVNWPLWWTLIVAYIYICETEQTPIDLINFDMFSKINLSDFVWLKSDEAYDCKLNLNTSFKHCFGEFYAKYII